MPKRSNLPVRPTGPVLPPDVELRCQEARIQAVEAATQAVPRVLQVLIRAAESGDVQAARLLLEVAGVVRRGSGVLVAVQNVVPSRWGPDGGLREALERMREYEAERAAREHP